MVYKMSQAFAIFCVSRALKKSNTPAISVVVGVAAALGKAPKTEGHIGGDVAIHAQ